MAQTRKFRTLFGLKVLNAAHPDIRRLKRAGHAPTLHGNKFWNSSLLIMKHLARAPLPTKARVMEIGCGWGLLGMYCAKQFGSRVVCTDADAEVFPFLHLHAELNGLEVSTRRVGFEELTTASLEGVDVLLGADICFWEPLAPVICNLIKRARRAGVEQIIISDPGRAPFVDLAGRCGALGNTTMLASKINHPVRVSGELLVIGQ